VEKTRFLAPLALTGAVSGMDKQGVFAHTLWPERLEPVVDEVCSVALADGAAVERSEILTTIRGLPPGMRSSLQKDVSSRVKPEVDGIGGSIIRTGRRNEVDTPVV
jgi:2-dehydropantoate 2-reductase